MTNHTPTTRDVAVFAAKHGIAVDVHGEDGKWLVGLDTVTVSDSARFFVRKDGESDFESFEVGAVNSHQALCDALSALIADHETNDVIRAVSADAVNTAREALNQAKS